MAAFQNGLATLDADLAALEALAQPFLPLSTYLGWIPVIGGDIEAAPHLLAMARHTVDGARPLSDSLVPLAKHLNQAEPGVAHLVPELIQELADAKPKLEAARDSLTLAAEATVTARRIVSAQSS